MLVVLPLLAGKTPMGAIVAQGLRPVGWMALGLGVLLLALHYALRSKAPRLQLASGHETQPPTTQRADQRGRLQVAQRSAQPSAADDAWPERIEPVVQTQPHAMQAAAQQLQPETVPPGNLHNPPAAPPQATPTASSHATNDPTQTWSAAVFAAIEWRRFEAVCETLFAQAGFETRTQSHGADGGVDIWLHSSNSPGPAAVVQCKHWQSKAVGVRELREFFGVMASHQLKRGTYATTSTYTADALAFAKANSIHTLDGAGLLQLIARRTPAQQQALLLVAFEGEYWRPTCASCGTKMVERTRRADGRGFWACANSPRCKNTMRKAGT